MIEKVKEANKRFITKKTKLEEQGWTKRFTIEEQRASEYVDLYEILGEEVRIEHFIPNGTEECQVCFTVESSKFRTIYTRQKHYGLKKNDLWD